MQQSNKVIIDGRELNDSESDTHRSNESEEIMAEKNKNFTISKIASSVLGSMKLSRASGGKLIGIASALFIMSSPAYSLGLGVLDVESNLDQPLDGFITVNVAPEDDVSSLSAEVASPEEFAALGIDYPEYLNKIIILVQRDGRDVTLKVTSGGVVIKEPFIHFLVKVKWSGGSFLREYTALIDPPVYASETPRSVAAPRAVGTDQSYSTDNTDSGNVYEESDDFEVQSIPDEQPTYVAPNQSSTSGTLSSGTDARYGPVASGESLSLIAQELQRQVPDLSIYAIMKILHEDNRDAFIDGNINGLIKGAVLTIRDINEIRAVDVTEARAFFQQQSQEWDPSLLNNTGSSDIAVGQDNYGSDSELFGTSSDTSSIADEYDNFSIGASNDTDTFLSAAQGEGSEGEVLALRQEISNLQSSLASSELENQELSERVEILEGQLRDLNKLAALSVEDADLASLEANLAANNQAQESLDEADAAINEFLSGDSDSEVLGSDTSSDELVETTDDILNEFLTDSGSEEGTISAGPDTESLTSNVEVADEVEEIAETKTPPKPVATPVIKSKPDESILDKIGGFGPIAGGLGAILLAGIAIFFVRRRRAADEEFEISMLSIESNSQSFDVDTDTNTGLSASMSASVADSIDESEDNESTTTTATEKETSFLTVYSDSDAVVQADEVDPIAEADVYIAYGRDEQAEEVLLDGITANPNRVDVKKKLLGLYFKTKNTEGFERISEELFAQKESMSGDEWQEISTMGKELLPDNPLFNLSGSEFDAVEAAAPDTSMPVDELSTEEEDQSVDNESEMLVFDTVDESSIDDVEAIAADAKSTIEEKGDEISDQISQSFNDDPSAQLINFDEDRSQISQLDEVEIGDLGVDEVDVEINDTVLEFDLELSDNVAVDLDDDAIKLDDDAIKLDDDAIELDDDAVELDMDSELDITNELSENDLVFDTDTIDFGSDDDFVEEPSEQKVSDVPEVSDLVIDPDYDEAQTQFELAKVFVDLGDDDGARKILDELVANSENSDELISKSQELLDSINS